MSKARLEAFSDGVFAIAITLLVLSLQVPHVAPNEIGAALGAMMPKFIIYIVSFILIGVYWVAHHSMFGVIQQADRALLWLNILLLLTISFIPFPTALLGEYPQQTICIALYGVTLMCANGFGTILWIYATRRHRLVNVQLAPRFIRFVAMLHSSPVLLYLLAVIFGFIDYRVSFVIFALVPLFFILPNPLLNRRLQSALSEP